MGAEIWDKHPDADAYRSSAVKSWTPFAYLMRHKRFSTAELFAQYWFARSMGHHPTEQDILYRFACLPHFDDQKETS